jgi:hypothetical protein
MRSYNEQKIGNPLQKIIQLEEILVKVVKILQNKSIEDESH